MNKTWRNILIIAVVVAIAIVGYKMWKKKQAEKQATTGNGDMTSVSGEQLISTIVESEDSEIADRV
jgi:lipopolysaccharide export system protein LptC